MVLKSLAIIPDGNRRFGAKHRLSPTSAYAKGFRKVEELLEWTEPTGIDHVTFWALSLENYGRRSKAELRVLFSLMRANVQKNLEDGSFLRKGVRVRFFGKLELLPKDLRDMMRRLEESTAAGKRELSIAVAYSGREELLQAARKVVVDFSGRPEALRESDLEKYLYLQQAPDLIIRTGGVSRLSGFLPWQTAYSELYFSKKLWPEFGRADFRDALEFFQQTERRFGK
jgi:undecaprenyl diphosphate synthase